MIEDLAWLGLDWDGPVRRQSDHFPDYAEALAILRAKGVLYPCFCTRKDIAQASEAPQGPDGPLYPGTCRALGRDAAAARQDAGQPFALRLDVARAKALTGTLSFVDEELGRIDVAPERLGDVVLARKETPCSYHLCVTLDDARQGVTLVTRGLDLLPSTHIHRLLQALLELPEPSYAHHKLINDPQGQRLAKRDGAPSIRSLREAGREPAELRASLGFLH